MMIFKKYTKKPVVIRATELTKDLWEAIHEQKHHEIPINGFIVRATAQTISPHKFFYVETLEGFGETRLHKAQLGDYLIVGIRGEIYACKPDIFHDSYEQQI